MINAVIRSYSIFSKSFLLRVVFGVFLLAPLLAAPCKCESRSDLSPTSEKFKRAPQIRLKPVQVVRANAAAQVRPFPAPELEGAAWLNTDVDLSLKKLRGRVVLLDFWTLCCINCIHILPDLAKLEEKYPGELVVIGVHSPKFPNEKKSSSIRKAILRYQIKHPVLNDASLAMWRRYRVTHWPTFVLIDPEGNFRGRISGEGHYDILDKNISTLIREYRRKGMLKKKPMRFKLVKEDSDSPLFFPGKVLADADSKRLFIADSTNNRIVITDLDGKKIAIAGTGKEGYKDGSFAEAVFADPQGMTLVGNILYVADRKSHTIRALDLKKQTVTTIAGTGKRGSWYIRKGGPAKSTRLNSPWDVLYFKNQLYIAMAGHHQIWTLNMVLNRVDPFAGTGEENIKDGALSKSAFAQPSGLATDGKYLYVADAETSAIRAMPMNGRGNVFSIVGQGLFVFGDVNGVGPRVRLQHALGVAYRNGLLYVTDTYNNKIKLINPATRACSTYAGSVPGMFDEPGGLSFAGDKIYVADTNAHRIQVVTMNPRKVTTLKLQGVEPVKIEK